MLRAETRKRRGISVLVYNPHPYRVKTVVECEYCLAEQNRVPDTFSKGDVFDEKGNLVACQNEKESSNIPIDWIKRVAFLADLATISQQIQYSKQTGGEEAF